MYHNLLLLAILRIHHHLLLAYLLLSQHHLLLDHHLLLLLEVQLLLLQQSCLVDDVLLSSVGWSNLNWLVTLLCMVLQLCSSCSLHLVLLELSLFLVSIVIIAYLVVHSILWTYYLSFWRLCIFPCLWLASIQRHLCAYSFLNSEIKHLLFKCFDCFIITIKLICFINLKIQNSKLSLLPCEWISSIIISLKVQCSLVIVCEVINVNVGLFSCFFNATPERADYTDESNDYWVISFECHVLGLW